jgi:radical SAM superfamily enzyme YgiQ (UPF0313 family)
VDNIIEEICLLTSQGYRQFIFVDDNLTMNPKRVIALCHRIRTERLDIEWFCEGRVDNSSLAMFRALSQAGCKVIFFGIESASQRILNYYHKHITPRQSRQAVTTARNAGIDVILGSFILGAPSETRDEMQQTLKFATQLSLDFPRFNILGAHPGTALWRELTTNGTVNGDDCWETGISLPKLETATVPLQEIQTMIHDALNHFFQRPRFIVQQLQRLVHSPYRKTLLRYNITRLNDIRQAFTGLKRID